jgi:hypothetical protein
MTSLASINYEDHDFISYPYTPPQTAIELRQHLKWMRLYRGRYIKSKSNEKFVIITKQGDDYLATYNGETRTMADNDSCIEDVDEFYCEFIYDYDEQKMLCRCNEKLFLSVYFRVDGGKKTGWIQTINNSAMRPGDKFDSFRVHVKVKFVSAP